MPMAGEMGCRNWVRKQASDGRVPVCVLKSDGALLEPDGSQPY